MTENIQARSNHLFQQDISSYDFIVALFWIYSLALKNSYKFTESFCLFPNSFVECIFLKVFKITTVV